MLRLSEDLAFHYEAIRIVTNIRPGNLDDWYREWHNLAIRVLSSIDPSKSYSPVTLKDVYFRASHYFFVSDFYTHDNWDDPRGIEAFKLWRKYFDMANANLPIPNQHLTLDTGHGFTIPVIIYRAPQASAANPRPMLILGGGFDSNMEELMHTFGFPALERGYNVIIYEGPGQPTLLREQKFGFIHDWEKAVTPIVDHVFSRKDGELSFIDTKKIGLLGWSLGGYLAARAAAFEPRIAAVICIDGVWDFGQTFFETFAGTKEALEKGDIEAFNRLFETLPKNATTQHRWIRDQMKYSFQAKTGYEAYQELVKMTLEGIAHKIKQPTFIGDPTEEQFFRNQPARAAKEIGPHATLVTFDTTQAAEIHVSSGTQTYLNQEVFEWFAGVVGDK